MKCDEFRCSQASLSSFRGRDSSVAGTGVMLEPGVPQPLLSEGFSSFSSAQERV